MDTFNLVARTKEKLAQITGLPASSVTGMAEEEGRWLITVEMLEKKSLPDSMDILGTYEVKVDNEGNLLDFTRTKLRKRGDTAEA